MTAEIVIMNREAIALASDSAVTSTTPSGAKIFTPANKLFALSQYHPVGIMVYGNSTLLDAPWELVIKTYRKHIGKKDFDTIEEYVGDFIDYINFPRPYGRGFNLSQTSFALHLFYPDLQRTLG